MKDWVKDFVGMLLILLDSRQLRRIWDASAASAVTVFEQKPLREITAITFLLPELVGFGGGTTSILKLGTELAKMGKRVRFLTIAGESNPVRLREMAEQLYPAVQGDFCGISGVGDMGGDVGIATSWETAYFLLRYQEYFRLGGYFIQDFEAGFYPLSHRFWLAYRTYQLGLVNIALGEWIPAVIRRFDSSLTVDSVTFPADLRAYPIQAPRVYDPAQPLVLAVYLKRSFRRGGALVWDSLRAAKEAFGDKIEIEVYGLLPFRMRLPFGINLGKLTAIQLRALYSRAHVGVVASFSNVSLVPFEMLASGLPVIDFDGASTEAFFARDEMMFSGLSPHEFVASLHRIIDAPTSMAPLVRKAQQQLDGRSWENSARQFIEVLERCRRVDTPG